MNETRVAPDGRYELRFSSFEVRMSHWIEQPYLVRVNDQTCLFTLHFLWSLNEAHWVSGSTLVMHIRLYPGLLSCIITLNVDANRGTAETSNGEVFTGTLANVSAWVSARNNPSKPFSDLNRPKRGFFDCFKTRWKSVLIRLLSGRKKP